METYTKIKSMTSTIFKYGLGVWFASSAYMSLNLVVNLFYKTEDPYIAKAVVIGSFLLCVSSGIVRQINKSILGKPKTNQDSKSKTGCKTCKKK